MHTDIEDILKSYAAASEEEKRVTESLVCDLCTPLVYKIAGRYRSACRNGSADFNDSVQNGYQGLLTAVRTYDRGRGAKFLTYAFSCIRKSVYLGIRDANISGRGKSHIASRLRQYRTLKDDLEKHLGHVPSVREIAESSGWKLRTILACERQLRDTLGLSEMSGYREDEGDLN